MNTLGDSITALKLTPESLGELIRLVNSGQISSTAARRVFAVMLESGEAPAGLVQKLGVTQVGDEAQLQGWAREVVSSHADVATRYRAGDERLFGFLMGEVMKQSRGKADPRKASEILKAVLQEG